MNCNEALELLSGHIDGENTPEQEAVLQAHLSQCPDCRELLAAYEQLDERVSGLNEPAPEGLARGIMYRIRTATGKKQSRRRWLFGPGTALGAVAAVFLLLLGTGAIRLPERSTQATAATTAAQQTEDGFKTAAEQNAISSYGIFGGETDEMQLDGENVLRAGTQQDPEEDGITVETTTEAASETRKKTLLLTIDAKELERCRRLSADNTAPVLLFTDVDKDFFSQLIALEPDFTEEFSKMTPLQTDDANELVYQTTYARLMALQEWFALVLPADEESVSQIERDEDGIALIGWERYAVTDADNRFLTTVLTKDKQPQSVTLPESWSALWAQDWHTERNWALIFPYEEFEPLEDDLAYIVLRPIQKPQDGG